ncbi:21075_t:CDS:2, partial [Gigaspora rosea]
MHRILPTESVDLSTRQTCEQPKHRFNELAVKLNSEEFTEEIEEFNKPLLIKLGRTKLEIVTKIKYQLEFEEYPETSENGVACVYNVADMDTEKALEIFDRKNIQYAYKNGTTCESVYCPFLNTKVYKETRTYRGIKICQFAAPELVAMTHTSVNFDDYLFKKIFEANELSLDVNTLNVFAAAHKREDNTSAPTYFNGCKNFKYGECGHRYQIISGRINIEYLKKLFYEHRYYNDSIIGE